MLPVTNHQPVPAGSAFVEQVRTAGAEARARIEPVGEAAEPTHHSSTSTCSPSMRAGSLASGWGGGPAFTAPVRSNTPPWHGHLSVWSSAFQLTRHPRWVQVDDSAVTLAAPVLTRKTTCRSTTWL